MVWKAALILVAVALPYPALAQSYCAPPRAPDTYMLRKPREPICFNGCTKFAIDSYNHDVEKHYADLRKYLNDVERYRADAQIYVKCMAKL